MNDTTRQIGGALGVAILGTLFNSTYALRIDNTLGQTLPPQALAVYAAASREHISWLQNNLPQSDN